MLQSICSRATGRKWLPRLGGGGNDVENVKENKMKPEETQILSKYSSGFTDKYMVNATLVKTMVFPTLAPKQRTAK